jgi:hypothetical protein
MQLFCRARNIVFVSFFLCTSLATVASSSDNIGQTRPGKTIEGDVVQVQGEYVSIKRHDTGEVVKLHVDKTTEQKDIHIRPMLGENVVAKYNEQTNHAISYLSDRVINR